MFDISVKKIDFEKQNTIIKKNINLDNNLDCFILISSNNQSLAENLINNTLEYLIDKISKNDTYNDFMIALEHLNSYLKTWRIDQEEKDEIDMIIGILNDNNYIFSNIGKSSACLVNRNSEIIELTENGENKEDFSYISEGKLTSGEIVVSSTIELLKYLSKSDLVDGLILADDIKIFNKNIKNILKSEIIETNCLVSSMKYISKEKEIIKNEKLDYIKNNLVKLLDNKFAKLSIGKSLVIFDKLKTKSKNIKNIILLSGILVAVFFLYYSLSTLVSITTQTENKELAKNNIVEIKNLVRVASENIANPDVFDKNIQDAENLILEVQKQEIYLGDLTKITDDINILKKQFNKIEIFETNDNNLIQTFDGVNGVKIAKNNLIPYIIQKKGVLGPILTTQKPQTYIFSNLGDDEEFIDGFFIDNNLFLLTNTSKIVKFTKNGYFNFVNVAGQAKWEDIKYISGYSTNLYTLGKDNQINKHSANGDDFKIAEAYLKKEDLDQIGEILSIAIDGGFYILKKDLTIVKFFSNPYRLESIILNKLPKNYTLEDGKKVQIISRSNLNYVYFLLNDKIWIFKPNTTNYKNTQNLTYVGQIEGASKKIKDFYVNYDGEIIVLNDNGLYKLTFEVSDNKLIIR
ncbi:MAG: hypothetical protein PHI37_05895 [Candidatus Gracilibacteria bacterium]|nr:hypothetical protein [Candidatus Gracilibacteria bacterium]